MFLFRAMKEANDGLPEIGPAARTLGVRPAGSTATNPDLLISNPDDIIGPGQGGMSVAPNDPNNLQRHRRPPSLGGIGLDPVWKIDSDDLGPALLFRRETFTHGLIEPKYPMMLQDYQESLSKTREKWEIHCR